MADRSSANSLASIELSGPWEPSAAILHCWVELEPTRSGRRPAAWHLAAGGWLRRCDRHRNLQIVLGCRARRRTCGGHLLSAATDRDLSACFGPRLGRFFGPASSRRGQKSPKHQLASWFLPLPSGPLALGGPSMGRADQLADYSPPLSSSVASGAAGGHL